jgi:O-antigen/teichoic acid export membrane protein
MVAGARGIPLAARVLTLLALARYTSEQDFAHAALIVAIAEAGRLVADLGTDTWSIRAIATSKSEDARALIIGDSLAVKALASSLLILSLWIAQSRLLPPMSITDLLLITMLVLSSQFVGLATSVEQALAKLRSLLPILAASYSLIFVIALLAATRTADGRLSLMAFGLCEAIVAGILLARLSDFQAVHWPTNVLRSASRMARASAPVAALNVMIGLYSRLDVMAVAQISSAAVATYSIAYRLFQPFSFAAAGLGLAVYARSSIAAQFSLAAQRAIVQRSIATALIAGSLGTVLLWLLGPTVVEGLFAGYSDAVPVLRMLAPLVLITAIGGSLTGILMGYGRFNAVLGIASLNLVWIGALLSWLVPTKGATGAAQALLMAEATNVMLQLWLVRKLVRRKA